jgi:hypothetical protein
MGSTPSDIAVKQDFASMRDLALNLELFEVAQRLESNQIAG